MCVSVPGTGSAHLPVPLRRMRRSQPRPSVIPALSLSSTSARRHSALSAEHCSSTSGSFLLASSCSASASLPATLSRSKKLLMKLLASDRRLTTVLVPVVVHMGSGEDSLLPDRLSHRIFPPFGKELPCFFFFYCFFLSAQIWDDVSACGNDCKHLVFESNNLM